MPYIIDNRAGSSIIIPDGALNQDFSIDLVGRNYTNYGEPIAKSFIDLLDNFAHGTAPTKQTNGQCWYDSTAKVLRVYDSVGGQWVPLTPLVSTAGVPSGENAASTTYYDQTNSKFYINDGTGYKIVGLPGETNTGYSSETAVSSPARYGTRLRNIFLEDSSSVPRAVTAIVLTNSSGTSPTYTNEEKLVAIFSGHANFTAGNLTSATESESANYYAQLSETGGIGLTIRAGLNLRADNISVVENSNKSYRSEAAYSINVGSYGSDGANISGSDVFHSGGDAIPTTTNTYDLGSSTNIFAEGHINSLTSTSVLSTGTSTIGASGTPFTNAYLSGVDVAGAVTFSGSGNLGTTGTRAGTGYFTGLNTSALTLGTQVYPTTDGTSGQQLITNGAGALSWSDPVSEISSVGAGNGLTGGGSSGAVTLNIGAGTGITVNADDIAVNIGGFTTDDLPEGSTNKYWSSGQSEGAITVTDAGGLGSLTKSGGTITYTGPSATDVRSQFSGANGVNIDAGGQITTDASEINHDGLNNFVASEHIDHSSISITAGDGLTGGGDITASRSFAVGAGTGITVNADSIEITPSEIRGLFSAGTGINLSAAGVISNSGVISDPDTSDFVTKAGSQTIGGAKTFTAAIVPQGGIALGAADMSYSASLVFSGPSGAVTFGESGSIHAEGDITAFSDGRLKENIEPIRGALDKVNILHGITFNSKGQKKRQAGLIAQDLQKVLPEVVHENEDGMLSVAYGNTVSLLVEAIKELRAEVAELRQESSLNGNK